MFEKVLQKLFFASVFLFKYLMLNEKIELIFRYVIKLQLSAMEILKLSCLISN